MSENELHSICHLQWYLTVEDLWLLPIFQTSGLLGVGQSSWWVFTIHFVGQHLLVFGVKALVEIIILHFLHVLWMDPSSAL